MTGAPLKVAVVGAGYFSQFHLAAWAEIAEAKLVAVCDLDAARAKTVADAFGAVAYGDCEAMARTETPDIVDIVAPPPAHVALVRAVLAPGRTIICQKPFCRSTEEATALTEEARRAGALLVVHENFRFQPWHREIRRFLEEDRLGAVYQCAFRLRPGDGRGPDAYLARQPSFQTMPKFLIQETGVHFIDLFRWLLGPVETVFADLRQLNPAIAGEDAGLMILGHRDGARSVFDGNRLSDHVAENPRTTMGEMAIEGEAGILQLDGEGRIFFRHFGEATEREIPVTAPIDRTVFGGGCVAALNRHVVAAMRSGREPENTAADYLTVMAVVDAAYRSATTGEMQRLA
ncbi:MAG: Gfo/Idh/MocA family oxidoreductase [Bauldia litoralis]